MLFKKDVSSLLNDLQDYLFPGMFSNRLIKDEDIIFSLGKMFSYLSFANYSSKEYVERLPFIKSLLLEDVEATLNGDPAARSKEEVIASYPGFYAIMVYRLAHELFINNVPLLPRLLAEFAHSRSGIDIHPGASIGHYFFIDHGTGVVIGETTIVGDNVRIYQGVTLGALSIPNGRDLRNVKRHPTIKNNVIIYANASILGGETIIGNNVVIGGNVFITSSIEDNKIVTFESDNYKIKENKRRES